VTRRDLDRAGRRSGFAGDLTRAASVRSRDRDSPGPGSRGETLWFRRGPDSRVVSARRLALVSPGASLARASPGPSRPRSLVARACAALVCRLCPLSSVLSVSPFLLCYPLLRAIGFVKQISLAFWCRLWYNVVRIG